MKKVILSISIFIALILICNISNATTITVSPDEPKVGDTVTVTVTVPNVHTSSVTANVSGIVSGTIKVVGGDLSGEAKSYSKSETYTCSKEGDIKVEITSDSSAVLNGQYVDVVANKTVTVKAKEIVNSGAQSETQSGTVATTTTANQKSTEARLSNLGIKPNDFSGFKRDKTEYSVEVPNNVTKVNVYATTVDSKAKVTSGTGNVSLKEGNNTVKVTVTAEAGNTKTYTLTIKRATEKEEEEEALEQIEETNNKTTQKFGISKLEIVGITLSPNFDTETYEYTAELNEDLEKLDIDAISTDEDAVIEILGNENLKQGENTITILVRNDEIEKNATYQITVNKNVIVKEEISWLNPSTWGREEIIKLIIIAVLIILVIIAIILKIKIAKEKKDDEDFDLPGGDELDKALAEHQELESTDDYYLQSEFDQEYDFEENNYIEDIAKNKDYKDDIYDNNIKRKGKHF